MTGKRYADLFCGLGAFHTAFDRLDRGYECVFACDVDERVRRIYQENHGITPHGDINTIDTEIPHIEYQSLACLLCQSY